MSTRIEKRFRALAYVLLKTSTHCRKNRLRFHARKQWPQISLYRCNDKYFTSCRVLCRHIAGESDTRRHWKWFRYWNVLKLSSWRTCPMKVWFLLRRMISGQARKSTICMSEPSSENFTKMCLRPCTVMTVAIPLKRSQYTQIWIFLYIFQSWNFLVWICIILFPKTYISTVCHIASLSQSLVLSIVRWTGNFKEKIASFYFIVSLFDKFYREWAYSLKLNQGVRDSLTVKVICCSAYIVLWN